MPQIYIHKANRRHAKNDMLVAWCPIGTSRRIWGFLLIIKIQEY
jgi:hypothetical protein